MGLLRAEIFICDQHKCAKYIMTWQGAIETDATKENKVMIRNWPGFRN